MPIEFTNILANYNIKYIAFIGTMLTRETEAKKNNLSALKQLQPVPGGSNWLLVPTESQIYCNVLTVTVLLRLSFWIYLTFFGIID